MAETSSAASTSNQNSDEREHREIRNLLWGSNIRADIFRRWSQGYFVIFLKFIIESNYNETCNSISKVSNLAM